MVTACTCWHWFDRAKAAREARRVCLLIDARHGAMDLDRGFMERLDAAAVSYQAVLTKADKVKPDGQCPLPRRDVHVVTEEIVALDDYFAQIDADAT
jgi:GTP-binding protein EngB required for normal cell division